MTVGTTVCRGFDEDMITVNPYLGTDGVKPFVDVCKEEKKGIFLSSVHFFFLRKSRRKKFAIFHK